MYGVGSHILSTRCTIANGCTQPWATDHLRNLKRSERPPRSITTLPEHSNLNRPNLRVQFNSFFVTVYLSGKRDPSYLLIKRYSVRIGHPRHKIGDL